MGRLRVVWACAHEYVSWWDREEEKDYLQAVDDTDGFIKIVYDNDWKDRSK